MHGPAATKKTGKLQNPKEYFNQSKYISGNISNHNGQQQSPASQTFFKENTKGKQTNSLIGKKGWPSLKKKNNNNNMYVSPYSKNPNPK
jgi:hypothetical protein